MPDVVQEPACDADYTLNIIGQINSLNDKAYAITRQNLLLTPIPTIFALSIENSMKTAYSVYI